MSDKQPILSETEVADKIAKEYGLESVLVLGHANDRITASCTKDMAPDSMEGMITMMQLFAANIGGVLAEYTDEQGARVLSRVLTKMVKANISAGRLLQNASRPNREAEAQAVMETMWSDIQRIISE